MFPLIKDLNIMKILNEKTCGVIEMSKKEMTKLNGGSGDRPFGRPDYGAPCGKDTTEKEASRADKVMGLFRFLYPFMHDGNVCPF